MDALPLHDMPYRTVQGASDELRSTAGPRELMPHDPCYPERLRRWLRPRPVWLHGQAELLDGRPVCTVVGSRACSRQAEERAFALGQALGQRGIVVVSGGALGVDAAAHRGALQRGGPTCAVVGTGIDVRYPKQHAGLQDDIAQHGLLLSMFALGAPPLPLHFRVRNELMAAIADVVVVVEAQDKSGSLITARHALRYGRTLCGFSGSEGVMSLLSSGAKLVRSIDEVVELASVKPASAKPASAKPESAIPKSPMPLQVGQAKDSGSWAPLDATLTADEEAARAVWTALLATTSADVGELCARTGLSADRCAAVLVDLELMDRCTRLAGGRYIVHAPLS